MLTVCCVKWGEKYGPKYVTRLKGMVGRHLPVPHEFICYTESPVDGAECRPLPSDLPSWWSKIGLFKPGLFEGGVLYLDLDVVITDSLMPLVELLDQSGNLWARDDFSYSMKRPRQDLDASAKRFLGGDGCINSSVMLWRGDAMREVWEKWDPAEMEIVHGDQNFISKVLRDRINFIPEHLVRSYKYAQLRHEPMAPVMVFHGNPKPDELPPMHPLRQMWETA